MTCMVRHGSEPDPTDGTSGFYSAFSPWTDLEELCWAQQNTDQRCAGFKVENWGHMAGGVQTIEGNVDESCWEKNNKGVIK